MIISGQLSGRFRRPGSRVAKGGPLLAACQSSTFGATGATTLVEGLLLIGLLLLSGFFSGSETALFALSDVELDELRRSGRRERQAVDLAQRPERTLVTILLANMIVNTIVSVLVASLALQAVGPAGLAVAIPTATILLLLFGEIVPKTLGLRRRRFLAVNAAPVLAGLAFLLGPVRRGLEFLASLVTRGGSGPAPLARDELSTLVDVARDEGDLTRFEGRVLRRILRFGDLPIGRCMTPRVDMVTVDADDTLDEALETFDESGRSRLPVVGDGPDDVIGVLLQKDVATHEGDRSALRARDLARAPVHEPETLPAAKLFRRFQRGRFHMAVVVGEHGGVEGIVTLEDLLEEMIGDIRDESDELGGELQPMGDGTWRGDATIEIADVADTLDLDRVPDDDDEAVTLSGLLQNELGRVPKKGDEIIWGAWRLRVLSASPNRARIVELIPVVGTGGV